MTETKPMESRCPCPYLEITENGVVCKATDWGTTEAKKHYGPIFRSELIQCSSPQHRTCPTFKRFKQTEE